MRGYELQEGASTGDDVLSSAEDVRRIRGVLALGGVPLQDLDDVLQTVRLRVLEHQVAPASKDGTDANSLAQEETNHPGRARGVVSTLLTQGRTRSLVALGATAALCLLVALVVVDSSPEDAPTDASQSLTDPELVACSDGIGFGIITGVEDTTRAWEVRLTLAMEEWLKPPANAGKSVSFATASAAERGERPFRAGERVLLVLQEAVSNHLVFRELPDPTSPLSAQGMGKEIRRILRQGTDTPCPSFWGQ